MSCGAGFGSPEGEPGEDGQEGQGAARGLWGGRVEAKPGWRLAPVRGSGRAAPLPVQALLPPANSPPANSPFDKSGALG